MSDIYQFNVGGTTYNLANLGLLAPVQITLTADRLYNTGDQFIYTGLLYEATETIAQGTSITIGSNAQLADCVTKQISEINSNLGYMYNYVNSNIFVLANENTKLVSSVQLPAGIYIVQACFRCSLSEVSGNQFLYFGDNIYDVFGFSCKFTYEGMTQFIKLESPTILSYGISPASAITVSSANMRIMRIK